MTLSLESFHKARWKGTRNGATRQSYSTVEHFTLDRESKNAHLPFWYQFDEIYHDLNTNQFPSTRRLR